MELGLKGKNAIVTGGSAGVGRAIALALSQEGANVAIGDICPAPDVLKECERFGVKAMFIQTDLSKPEDCINLVNAAEKEFGQVDILINNAGLWPTNLVADIPLAEWHKTVDINLTAVFLTCQTLVQKALAAKRKARILNVTSQAAFNGSTTGHAHYAASKSGVVTFTISLAREVSKLGINVNAIALGMVETGMSAKALAEKKEYYESRIMIGRVAQPEEIAKIATFLVSEPAGYLTGSTFDATGGMLSR
ncbi:oxidoreductase, short chain dehydrogenase/reductase family protein [Candidatus Moduliflexus flocculans]|uniref:Oxidoreductase, short chain dehydrogenase/reductase family protein n=1 Tax=Candidatus Moduliflexus flocculans TaxID=1499966 RepID=A0A0S6VZ77_9BACT|nr:oxidoreductase, short chain dehydrogenase/reductase family protein [Candidatus Moduliflexus flocculans]